MSGGHPRAWLATPPGRGGVAIVEIVCERTETIDRLIEMLTGGSTVEPGRFSHRTFVGIDDGIVLRVGGGQVQIMPHGGPGIVRELAERLVALSVEWCDVPPSPRFPEAADPIEGLMLETLAHAASPAAVDPLLVQPERWRDRRGPLDSDEAERSVRLQRLIDPPLVACIGPPNAGKSSILNALLRDRRVIVSREPGTTRDRIGVRIDLDGVVVDWIDTPGLRETDDPVERAAIEATCHALGEAALLVRTKAPDVVSTAIPGDLRPAAGVIDVWNKCDLASAPRVVDPMIPVSATTGEGILDLARAIRSRLVHDEDLAEPGRWEFHPTLPEL